MRTYIDLEPGKDYTFPDLIKIFTEMNLRFVGSDIEIDSRNRLTMRVTLEGKVSSMETVDDPIDVTPHDLRELAQLAYESSGRNVVEIDGYGSHG